MVDHHIIKSIRIHSSGDSSVGLPDWDVLIEDPQGLIDTDVYGFRTNDEIKQFLADFKKDLAKVFADYIMDGMPAVIFDFEDAQPIDIEPKWVDCD